MAFIPMSLNFHLTADTIAIFKLTIQLPAEYVYVHGMGSGKLGEDAVKEGRKSPSEEPDMEAEANRPTRIAGVE